MKNKLLILLLSLALLLLLPVSATEVDPPELLRDMADLLDDGEASVILSHLHRVSDKYNLDVVIVTVEDTEDKSPMAFADDFYDENGYGRGQGRDGLLLLISMAEGDWWISTSGYGITAFTDAGIDYLGEQFVPYLSSGDFSDAFVTFAEQCDAFLAQAKTGDPFDSHNLPKEPFDFATAILVSLGVGLVIALIYTSSLKGQLKTVRRNNRAADYVRKDSLNLTAQNDFYLYRTVTRVRRETESDSGGGSSTHTSSSGNTHGGGGGKF